MADRVVRVQLIGDASSLVAAARESTRALTDLSKVDLGKVKTGMQGAGEAAGKAAGKASGWGEALKIGLGVTGVQAGFAAITQGFQAVMDTGLSYEKNMHGLQAVTGASVDQMKQASDQAKLLGADLSLPGASAQSATAAMVALAKGGMTVQQAMDAARGTILLASAAQIDGATAAKIQTDALSVFGLAAGQAGMVADVLANVSNAASGDIGDFALGMQQAGTVAHAFGWDIKDTTVILGLLAKEGIRGSDAGTSLKTTLTTLLNPTKAQAAALDKLGVVTRNSNGSMISAAQFTDQLAAAKGRMTEAEFAGLVSTALGQDAMRTGFALAEEGTGHYNEMAGSIGTVGGAQRVAAANSAGLTGALDKIASAAGGLAVSLYETLAPALTKIVEAGGAVVGWAGGAVEWFGKLPGPVKAISAALAGVLLLNGPLNTMWASIKLQAVTAFQIVRYQAEVAGAAMRAFQFTLIGVQTAAKGLLAALGGPIGVAILAVTTAMSFMGGSMDDAAKSTDAAADAVKGLTQAYQESSGQVTTSVRAAALASIQSYKDEAQGIDGLIGYLERLGVSRTTAVDAMTGNGAASAEIEAAYQRQREKLQGIIDTSIVFDNQGHQTQTRAGRDAQAALEAITREHDAWVKLAEASSGALGQAQANQDAINGTGHAAAAAAADMETLQKAVKDVNDAMGDNMSLIAFKDILDKSKAAEDAAKLAGQGLTASLLGVAGGSVAAAAATRGYDAAMRGIGAAARQHESALAGVATAQAALDKLRAHGTNTAEDVANAQKSADKAAKDVLTSQQELMKAQEKAAKDLTDARRAAAKQQADDAKTEREDRAGILKAQAEADKDVRDAEQRLSKDRAEGAKKVAEEKAAAEKDRKEAAKSLADAQAELSKARDSAAREIALAQARVDKLANNKRYTAQERADAARHLADAKALGQADINEAAGKVGDVRAAGAESAAQHAAAVQEAMAKNRETIADDERAVREARSKGAEAVKAAQEKLAEDQAKSAEDRAKAEQSIADAVQAGADSVAAAQQRIIDATDSASEAQRKLADEQAKSVPTAAELAAAQQAVAEANARVADASDAQADALDKAAQAARDAAAAAYTKAGGDANAQAAAKAAGDEMAIQRQKFIDSAMAAGYGADEANRLANQQGLIPKNVTTFYAESGHQGALLKAKELQEALDKIPGIKNLKFVVDGSSILLMAIPDPKSPFAGKLQEILNLPTGAQPGPFIVGSPQNPGHAAGGFITGPGGPTDDTIAARLSNGEFVVNAAQAAKHRQLLEAINNGTGGYAAGGAVGAPDTSAVGKAWDGVSDKIVSTWDRTVSPTLEALNTATTQTGSNFVDLQKKSVEPTWSANGNAITKAANGVILPQYDALNAGTAAVGDANRSLRSTAVEPSWQGIQATVSATTGALTGATFPSYVSGLQGLGSAGRTLAADTSSSWTNIGSSVESTYVNHIAPAWSAVQGFTTSMGRFFGGVNTGMVTASTTTTTNLGTITKAIDAFFRMVDGKAPLPTTTTIPAPAGGGLPKLADGGLITQGTGPRADDVHIRASKGEYVVNAASTSRHKDTLDRINYGGAFADGGLVGEKIGNRVGNAIIGGAEKAISAGVDRILASVPVGLGGTGSGGYVSNQQWGPGNTSGLAGNTQAAKDFITGKWGLTDIGGLGGGSVPGSDHPIGKALDVMIANYKTPPAIALGTSVADWFRSNVMSFGSKYVIWRDQIDNLKGKGWEPYQHPSGNNDTLQHRDHVHLSFLTGTGVFSGHPEDVPDDVPTKDGWLAKQLKKIRAGGTGTTNGLIVGPPGQWGTTRGLNTVDPLQDFGAMNMSRGTAAMVGPVPPGGAVERWRPMYLHALAMLGKPAGAIDKMMYQMFRESSGDPLSYAIDQNYYAGHPSKSLLQVIPSTFKANAPAGYNTNIWDPLSNALASLNYIKDPYKYPGGAYDNGGMLQPGWNFNGLGTPEPVLTDQQWGVASRAINWAIQAAPVSVAAPVVEVRNYLDGTELDARTEVIIDGAMQELAGAVTRQAAQS